MQLASQNKEGHAIIASVVRGENKNAEWILLPDEKGISWLILRNQRVGAVI